VGTGTCDDNLAFLWAPDMIKAYLGRGDHPGLLPTSSLRRDQ
jgi:uncharacterized circularly permuted ATP-grasp superfamily protein